MMTLPYKTKFDPDYICNWSIILEINEKMSKITEKAGTQAISRPSDQL